MYIVSDGKFSKIYSRLTEKEVAQFVQMNCAVLRIATHQAGVGITVYEVDEDNEERPLKETPR